MKETKKFKLYSIRENLYKRKFFYFLFWIISPLLFARFGSCRDRSWNRAIKNSSASARERRWPRVESIWTTFSLARWPCNCPVASAKVRYTVESLSNLPLCLSLSLYISLSSIQRWFFFEWEAIWSFQLDDSPLVAAREAFVFDLSSQHYMLIIKSNT